MGIDILANVSICLFTTYVAYYLNLPRCGQCLAWFVIIGQIVVMIGKATERREQERLVEEWLDFLAEMEEQNEEHLKK